MMKVLLVDNSLLVLQRLEELISDTVPPCSILKAVSYADAMSLFVSNEPGIVILDINLPKSASFCLLQEIKREAPGTLVVVLSIHTDEYIQQQCKLIGADFFFDKYDEFEKIPAVLNTLQQKIPLKSA